MNIAFDCYPCLVELVTRIVRQYISDPAQKHTVLKELLGIISASEHDVTAPEIAACFYKHLQEKYDVHDPYAPEKKKFNQWVLQHLSHFRRAIQATPDPLRFALKLSALGNIIDFGVPASFDIDRAFSELTQQTLAIDHSAALGSLLTRSQTLLLIADNAGEIGLDMLLLEEIKRQFQLELHCLVRGGPILNDATTEDALFFGLERVAHLHHSGVMIPGTPPSRIQQSARELLFAVDLVISKGQGNFETLSDVNRDVFFLLRSKCQAVADYLKVNIGDSVLYYKK
ncbi:DUF89 domain-containing protein [candidate division CSSED10-310 bacterium]|uniref:DUF89 domain-containing protein n=1 Tax=candidate division CSSED10-310 bacterium TaxID=2855610 RepID=A0ABV6YXS5_UNCC1